MLNVVGYGIEVHYCLGQISDVSYAFLDTSYAFDSDHTEVFKAPCCDDESFFVQLEDEHQNSEKLSFSQVPCESVHELDSFSSQKSDTFLKDAFALRAPPVPIDRVTIYQFFIFYA